MLKFNGSWRFESPGALPAPAAREIALLIGKVAAQGDLQKILEHFKDYFAPASGTTSSWSSSASWSETDLNMYMDTASANAPLFIEAFYDACETLKTQGIDVPSVTVINEILSRHGTGFEIQPPHLVSRNTDLSPIQVEAQTPSLDDQAREIIQNSLTQSEQLLAEGRHRLAVQEILWLLETVSTAFQGLGTATGTIQGKYFNKIVSDLQKHNQGTTLDQVLAWITALHGYLSSPTGGRIRHGGQLKSAVATTPAEARLFCNLIRSYITFLLVEYERLHALH